MKSVLVWDMPIRLFHWLLAACCIASFALAFGSPEKSQAFDWHMLTGYSFGTPYSCAISPCSHGNLERHRH